MSELSIEELFSVAGKNVLVTGGSRGIGEMIAAGFLANGAKVYISSRKAEVCDATAARLAETYGGTCVSIPADLASTDGATALAAALGEREQQPRRAREQRRRLLGRAAGGVPRERLGQGHGHQREGGLLPHPGPAAAARSRLPAPSSPARVINVGSIDGLRTSRLRQLVLRRLEGGGPRAHPPARRDARQRNILVNAIAPGPFPTWMLSTGVGGGGDVRGHRLGAGWPGQSPRARRQAQRHRRNGPVPRLRRPAPTSSATRSSATVGS